ncbi:MAG: ATP-dependent helicase [Phycisphaerales bacterium]
MSGLTPGGGLFDGGACAGDGGGIAARAGAALESYGLSEPQRRAVEHDEGALIVLAGPGTGKTRVLTARILRLLRDGASPESVLALTYTTKAAREMRERLGEAIGDGAGRVRLLTFHALAWRLIHRFGDVLGLPARIRLRDSGESARVLRAICRRDGLFALRGGEGSGVLAEQLGRFVHACRSADRSPGEALESAERWIAATAGADESDAEAWGERLEALQFGDAARGYAAFERETREAGLIGYDDSLSLACELLHDRRFAGPVVRGEIRHVLVDEFQDVNPAQITMLRGLAPAGSGAGGGSPDVMVVGDDDQAIYAFRGASARAFERFEEIYGSAGGRVARVRLETNYRSRERVVALGQFVIGLSGSRFDPDKSMVAGPVSGGDGVGDGVGGEGGASGIVEVFTIDGDVKRYASLVGALIQRDRARTGRGFDSYAVIVRANTRAEQIATVLRLAGIPVDRRHRRTPLENPGVQDLLAWIELLLDPGAVGAAQRLLIRPPVLAPADLVGRWIGGYARAGLVVAEDGDADGDGDSEPAGGTERGFYAWALESIGDLPGGVRTMLETSERLSRSATILPAERAIEAIIHETGLLSSAETPRERAELIADLAGVLRFVRARIDHAPAPGNLAAFWSHYHDMDPRDRTFDGEDGDGEEGGAASLDPDAGVSGEGGGDGGGGGVTVVTAHSAKGLEFDTVFVVDVRPPHGFPQTRDRSEDGISMPAGFEGEPEPVIEEERRLFYVACTRAERRLVLIGKARKAERSKSTDFLMELQRESARLSLETMDGTELAAEFDAELEGMGGVVRGGREGVLGERLRIAARRIRHSAFAALHEAEGLGGDERRLDELGGALARHARALAAVRAIERGSPEVAHRLMDSLSESHRDVILSVLRDGEDGMGGISGIASPFEPMRAPLSLSYSAINEYQRCPRCFWIRRSLGLQSPASDAQVVGTAVHAALESHFRALRSSEAGDGGGGGPDPARTIRGVRKRVLDATAVHSAPDPALIERAEAMVETALLRMHGRGDEILELEHRFEFVHRTAEDPGTAHRITGRIDRLDRDGDGMLRVVDYKTGMPVKRLLKPKKDDLQMGIYAIALMEMFGGSTPAAGEYWLLATGERGRCRLDDLDLDRIRAEIDSAIGGMLAGRFEQGEKCEGICRVLEYVGMEGLK